MEDQLVDFIRGKKGKAPSPDIDWQAKKDTWVGSVDSLYGYVREMLRESIASNDVTTNTVNVEVSEDFIGSYSMPVLELSVGSERVEFRPKGINVIGAAGRVDIRGERDTVTLLRDEVDFASGWGVVIQRVPHLKKVDLDRDSLKFALERVMLP